MKLLNSAKTEVAFLDEGTTKVAYYGDIPALIYFTGATKTSAPNECTITKIESLTGYIETDAGEQVAITGALQEKIDTLETLLGCKLGYTDPASVKVLPVKTTTFYKSKDKNDSGTITITVHIDGDDKIIEFTRGPNAVTVKAVLAKLADVIGEAKVLEVTNSEGKNLTKKDKLLEDQEITIELKASTTPTLAVPINLIAATNTVKVGETVNVTSNVEGVLWTTSNAETATVDNGVVTGVSAGEVTITATKNGHTPGNVTLTVTAAE